MVMGVTVALLRSQFPSALWGFSGISWLKIIVLLILVTAGIASYTAMAYIFKIRIYTDFFRETILRRNR